MNGKNKKFKYSNFIILAHILKTVLSLQIFYLFFFLIVISDFAYSNRDWISTKFTEENENFTFETVYNFIYLKFFINDENDIVIEIF